MAFNTRVQLDVALRKIGAHNTVERNEADDAANPGEETETVMYARFTRQVQGCRPARGVLPAVWQWRWTFAFLWRMSVRVAHNTAAMRARLWLLECDGQWMPPAGAARLLLVAHKSSS